MPKRPAKTDFPVSTISRRYLEPGPIVLVSSAWRGKTNIMTMGWHTVMEFARSGRLHHRGLQPFIRHDPQQRRMCHQHPDHGADRRSRRYRDCSANTDKFEKFGLTAEEAKQVESAIARKCHANLECRIHDDALIDKYNFFIFEVVKAHVAERPKHPETLHYTGDSVFGVGQDRQPAKAISAGEPLICVTERVRSINFLSFCIAKLRSVRSALLLSAFPLLRVNPTRRRYGKSRTGDVRSR